MPAIPHEVVILVGFIACEVTFNRIEHFFHQRQEKFKALRHGTLVVWAFHPSVTSGLAEWVNHTLAAAVVASGH